MFKTAQAGNSKTNVCRNLTKLLHKKGVTLNVEVDFVQISAKREKKKNRVEKIWFPILRMTAWVRCLLAEAPQLLLAGHSLEDEDGLGSVFSNFWNAYRSVDSTHPIFQSSIALERAIPYMLHGDEGRGQRNVPYMVEAWQVLIGHHGTSKSNESS